MGSSDSGLSDPNASGISAFGLTPAQFAFACPFHLVLDAQFRVLQMGSSFGRLFSDMFLGVSITERFSLVRRSGSVSVTWDSFRENAGRMLLLRHRTSPILLRVQWLANEKDQCGILLGTPWVTNAEQLQESGLSFDDFPVHEPWLDLMELHQVQASANKDFEKLNAKLIAQRAELRTLADRLKAATDAGGVGVWDYNLVTNELIWDDQMFQLYGVTRDHFSGSYEAWEQGLHPDDKAPATADLMAAIQEGKVFDTEFRVVWPDGSVHHIKASGQVQRDANGKATRMIGVNQDITARYELEAQRRKRFESETMLKEIHHRVKNNMQVISSLLSLQSVHMDPNQRGVFLECRDRIRAMSLIHEKLYTTGQFGAIDFGDYLRDMVFLVSSSNKPANLEIDFDIQVESIEVTVDQAVPLSLIASELILNSMKHAFRNRSKGAIIVRLQRDGDACRLFIGDDGPGIPPGERHGTSQSIGLKLINGLAKQIRAELEKYPGPGAGLTITWKL